ncbi:unnamed protein product [Closterium sp. NIES-65]|nr:unnamed protein product [Closterium sp. NIES-65]
MCSHGRTIHLSFRPTSQSPPPLISPHLSSTPFLSSLAPSRGEGILAASLAGPNFYPSAASHSHPSSHPPNSRLPPTPSSLAPSWGEGILAASLAGPNFYPSAAYARINGNTDVGRIVVAGPGKAPLDDYLTYRFNIPVLLYGDFMSATIDEDGNVWAAVEYVGGVERTDYSD